jgi:hypothetical protein
MSAGNIESDSYIIAGPCTQLSQAKTNSPICTTFCRSGDCSKPTNLYSYAIPGQGVTVGVQPSQVVTSLYQISVEDPTIVGITGNDTMLIFACRDSNCADYNQATFLKLDGGIRFGQSLATTLTRESSLAILYLKSKTGGGFDLMLDICKDPVCNLKGTSTHIDTLVTDSDVWLGFDVNTNAPLILVSDSHTQTLVSYSCTASVVCTKNAKPLVAEAFNAFSVSPVQQPASKKPKKPLTTTGFVVAYGTYSPQAKNSSVMAMQCAADLSACSAPVSVISNTFWTIPFPLMSLSILAASDNTYQLAYVTLDLQSVTGALYLWLHCGAHGAMCEGAPSGGNFSLGFTPDMHSFEFDVQVLYSSDSGYTALTQASNAWQATDSPGASALFGVTGAYPGAIYAVEAPKYQVSKYHKAPPKVTIALFILAGVAVLSTIGLIVWRVLAGNPTTPGYTRIN